MLENNALQFTETILVSTHLYRSLDGIRRKAMVQKS